MSDQDDIDFDQTLTGMFALGRQSEHGDAKMLLKTARGIEGLRDKQATHTTRLALLETAMNDVKAASTHDRVARIAKTEMAALVKDVARLEKWLYAIAAAVGIEALHAVVVLLGGKS